MEKYNLEDIIRYTDQEMGDEEKVAFENALQTDSDLEKEYQLYLSVNQSLKQHLHLNEEDLAFKDNISKYQQQYFGDEQKTFGVKIIAFKKYWYVAAVLLLALFIWAPWNQDLYNKYSSTEMVTFTERGESETSRLQKAADYFNSDKFTEAKEILAVLSKEKPEDDLRRFYLALTQLETNEIAESQKNLNLVYQKQSVFKYNAAFYMALSYLKKKDKTTAKQWLNKIPADSDEFDKAQELLGKL